MGAYNEWTNHGRIVEDLGRIYRRAIGGLTKKGETFYLYYNRGWRGTWEANRKGSHTAIGLATSTDGVNWTKHPANPIMIPTILAM